jgi:hypothetical protein
VDGGALPNKLSLNVPDTSYVTIAADPDDIVTSERKTTKIFIMFGWPFSITQSAHFFYSSRRHDDPKQNR